MEKLILEKPTKNLSKKIALFEFNKLLADYKSQLSKITSSADLQSIILNRFSELCSVFCDVADETSKILLNNFEITEQATIYYYNYKLPAEFKEVSVLHRNVLLELNKAEVINLENKIDEISLDNHFNKSKEVLLNAVATFIESIATTENFNATNKAEVKKIESALNLYKSPWYLYKSQFTIVQDQIISIEKSKHTLLTMVKKFAVIRQTLDNVGVINKKVYIKFKKDALQVENFLVNKNSEELARFIDLLKVEEEFIGNNLAFFTDDITVQLIDLKTINIPVKYNNGLLTFRENQLAKTIRKWLDFKVLPEFMDLIGFEDIIRNKYQFTISNLSNSIQLVKKTGGEIDYASLNSTIQQLKGSIEEFHANSIKVIDKINDEIRNELLVSNILKDRLFLNIPIKSAINFTGTSLKNKIRDRYHKVVSYFTIKFEKSNHQDSFTNLELASKCIVERTQANKDEHYDLIFLSKNFIGDLFLIPRKLQEQQLEDAVSQWNKGFGKAVLVTGDRLCGKSTFLDFSSKKYFGKQVINLMPNSVTTVDGRKFKTSANLKESLQHLKSYSVKSTRPILRIDDIELWQDAENSLLNNVRSLINFIENFSEDIFVVVSTTNVLSKHLDNRFKFSNGFSTLIDLSIASKNEILEAVILRHGASHKLLVSENLVPYSDSNMRSLINKIGIEQNKNIGLTLQAWTYSTINEDDDKVIFKINDNEFADFFSQEELIILKQASLFKNISEVSLIKVIPAKNELIYKSALKRLINTKVLLRNTIGKLYINPIVLSEVQVLLIRKKIIN